MKRWRGSLTVEAALIIPLVVILLVPFLEILRTTLAYTTIRTAVFECADQMADYGFLYESAGLLQLHREIEDEGPSEGAVNVTEDVVEEQLEDILSKSEAVTVGLEALFDLLRGDSILRAVTENVYPLLLNQAGKAAAGQMMKRELENIDLEALGVRGGWEGLDYTGTRIFYQSKGHGALIRLQVSYYPSLIIEGGWLTGDPIVITATVHAFIGADAIETGSEEDEVFYQIGNGEKYHSADCYLARKEVEEMTPEEAAEAGYNVCRRCGGAGSSVWVTSGGESYHTKECSYLYPVLRGLTLEEIEAMELEPCRICVGEGGWFS